MSSQAKPSQASFSSERYAASTTSLKILSTVKAKTTADHTGDMYVSFVRPLLPCGLTDSFVASQVVVVCTRPAVYRRAASTAADLMQHNGRRIQLPELRIVVLKCREYSEAALRAK